MSFQPYQFVYEPPETVESIPSGATSAPSVIDALNTTNQGTPNTTTVAGTLIAKLQNLIDTSTYLQALILAKNATMGIEIDPNVDPDTAAALSVIYQNQNVPVITAAMFSNLLDGQLNLIQLKMAIGKNSTIVENNQQFAQTLQTTKAFTNALVDSGLHTSLELAHIEALKGDSVIFANIQNQLADYPAYTNIGTLTDVGPPLATSINSTISTYQGIYASTYTLATTNPVMADASNVLSTMLGQTANELTQLAALISTCVGMSLKTSARTLLNGLTSVILVQMISETSGQMTKIDRMGQQALAPILSIGGSLSSVMGSVMRDLYTIKRTAQSGTTATNIIKNGPMTGMSNNNMTVGSLPSNSGSYSSSQVGSLSSGVQILGESIAWAQTTLSANFTQASNSFTAMTLKRTAFHTDTLNIQAMMQAMNTIMSLISATKSSAATGTTPTPTGNTTPLNGAVPSMTNTQAVGSSSNNSTLAQAQAILTSNSIPTQVAVPNIFMPSDVLTTLTAGGAKITSLNATSSVVGATNEATQ
jgi:hypothetical protein